MNEWLYVRGVTCSFHAIILPCTLFFVTIPCIGAGVSNLSTEGKYTVL